MRSGTTRSAAQHSRVSIRADAAASMRVAPLPWETALDSDSGRTDLRDRDAGAIEPGQRAEPRDPEMPARGEERPHEPFGRVGAPGRGNRRRRTSSRSSRRPSPAAAAGSFMRATSGPELRAAPSRGARGKRAPRRAVRCRLRGARRRSAATASSGQLRAWRITARWRSSSASQNTWPLRVDCRDRAVEDRQRFVGRPARSNSSARMPS